MCRPPPLLDKSLICYLTSVHAVAPPFNLHLTHSGGRFPTAETAVVCGLSLSQWAAWAGRNQLTAPQHRQEVAAALRRLFEPGCCQAAHHLRDAIWSLANRLRQSDLMFVPLSGRVVALAEQWANAQRTRAQGFAHIARAVQTAEKAAAVDAELRAAVAEAAGFNPTSCFQMGPSAAPLLLTTAKMAWGARGLVREIEHEHGICGAATAAGAAAAASQAARTAFLADETCLSVVREFGLRVENFKRLDPADAPCVAQVGEFASTSDLPSCQPVFQWREQPPPQQLQQQMSRRPPPQLMLVGSAIVPPQLL